MRISPRDKPDIVVVAEGLTRLRRSGKSYSGLCPIHGEKTASFYVFPEKQTFKCFGCGEHGDVVELVMKASGISFTEACARLGIALKGGGRAISLRDRKRAVAQEVRALERRLLFEQVLRMRGRHNAMFLRHFNRSIGLKCHFFCEEPEEIIEKIPALIRWAMAHGEDPARIVWQAMEAARCYEETGLLHLGEPADRLGLYGKIIKEMGNGDEL